MERGEGAPGADGPGRFLAGADPADGAGGAGGSGAGEQPGPGAEGGGGRRQYRDGAGARRGRRPVGDDLEQSGSADALPAPELTEGDVEAGARPQALRQRLEDGDGPLPGETVQGAVGGAAVPQGSGAVADQEGDAASGGVDQAVGGVQGAPSRRRLRLTAARPSSVAWR